MSGTFSPPPRVSDPDMHHGTCITHVSWCMPGSLTSGFLWNRRWGRNVPGIPGACATRKFTYLVRGPCCWQEQRQWMDDGSRWNGPIWHLWPRPMSCLFSTTHSSDEVLPNAFFFWRRQVSSHSSSYNEAIPWRHCISQWRTSIMAGRQNTWWSSHTENVVVDISQFHESSGYSSTLVASGVCTQGAADAILKVTNICHTWYIEQLSVMALQKLKQRAYAEKSHDNLTPKQTTIQETVITEMVLMVAWLNCHKLRSSSSRNGSASMDLSLKISWWRGTFSCGRTIGVG